MIKLTLSLLLITAQLAYADQPIGRLFSSPIERDELDYLRRIKKPTLPAANAIPVFVQHRPKKIERVEIQLPASISMQGYVKRNDGKDSTVWINNQAATENSRVKDVQIGSVPENSNRVPIKLIANGKGLALKAGQVYDPKYNRVSESRGNPMQDDSGLISD